MTRTSIANIMIDHQGYDGTKLSCAMALMPATPMPNQRAMLLPVTTAKAAASSRTPTPIMIQPHVRTSLNTYVLKTP